MAHVTNNQVLWGFEHPQIQINGIWYDLPRTQEYDYWFEPEGVEYMVETGELKRYHWGFRLMYVAYYTRMSKDEAMRIRDAVNASAVQTKTNPVLFRPHSDFNSVYRVYVKKDRGWDFKLAWRKAYIGWGGSIKITGIDLIYELDAQETYYPFRQGIFTKCS